VTFEVREVEFIPILLNFTVTNYYEGEIYADELVGNFSIFHAEDATMIDRFLDTQFEGAYVYNYSVNGIKVKHVAGVTLTTYRFIKGNDFYLILNEPIHDRYIRKAIREMVARDIRE